MAKKQHDKKKKPTSNINPLHISSAWKLHYFQNLGKTQFPRLMFFKFVMLKPLKHIQTCFRMPKKTKYKKKKSFVKLTSEADLMVANRPWFL